METRFLIIDDDAGFRRTISYIIEKYHLGVIAGSYGDGREAEANLRELRPDIVIVDLLLPGQSGIELVKKFDKINNKISYIMVSACSNKSIINQAYQNGIDFYLPKPINVVEFTSVIKKIVESKQSGQTNRCTGEDKRITSKVICGSVKKILSCLASTFYGIEG